jgi:hypothetical protein
MPSTIVADDARSVDAQQDVAIAVLDTGPPIEKTVPVDISIEVYEIDPAAPLTMLFGQWAPRRFAKVATLAFKPFVGERVTHTMPDGSKLDLRIERMLNGASWSGTQWVHDIVLVGTGASSARAACRLDNPFTFEVAARPYTCIVKCDASGVPPTIATDPVWMHAPRPIVDASTTG